MTPLLLAKHKEHEFIFNNEIHKVTPGQLITGRKKLSHLTGIPQTTIRRILKWFENGHMVQRKITSKYTVITITKWEKYKSELYNEDTGGHQTAGKRPTSDHQATTYKNEKNEKNDNKHRRAVFYSKEELEIKRIDANFEKAKAEFLRRAEQHEKEAADTGPSGSC